jgi:pimeloyl-ACP methyl ester carboxylesterase
MKGFGRLVTIFLGGILVTQAAAQAPNAATDRTQSIKDVVLVHGAWADGSSWNRVIPLLEKKGFHVTAVHLPFTTLADDVAAVKRMLAFARRPCRFGRALVWWRCDYRSGR